MKEIDKLQPRAFTRFCMSIGAVPSSYISALTIEEQILWFCSYLEKEVIPAVNNNAEAVTELQNLYVQLKDYVDNYFENLDVQDEIDNKLEEMAQSGELAEVIAQYLESQAIIGFNTCSGLAAAENLAAGSYARTMGRNTYLDGYGAFYRVRERLNSDDPDGYHLIVLTETDNLVAEMIPDATIASIQSDIANIQNAITGINGEIDKIKGITRKLAMIGDSYAAGYTPEGSIPSWCNYVCNYLGLTYSSQVQTALGGTGFATDTNNFNTLATALTADNDVTDVIVAGGYNDISKTSSAIITGITNTVTTLKTKFPNAKIHIAFIGCSTIDNAKFFYNTYLAYVQGCTINKVHYMKNVEIAMHDIDTLSSDHLHPSAKGHENVGKYTAESIKYGIADGVFPEIALNNRINISIHNHDFNIRCTQGGFEVNITDSVQCTGSYFYPTITGLNTYVKHEAKFINNSWITNYTGATNIQTVMPIVHAIFQNSMSTAYLKENSAGTNWDTITNINWINVTAGETKLETMLT